ncbi:phhA [Lepeophtheirus salmonis]|uniref:phenylalanine 4-monooxygenase n=2 Tax=Lepeophtheirus salmonis TaxID=72036 RepID=A0A7R8CV56_LEPSM|nr:phhA [Lepeophtheirus salmonis]CAF2942172.1 phhA [Lepeophtheirus salmonis]
MNENGSILSEKPIAMDKSQYIRVASNTYETTTIIFGLNEETGSLAKILVFFKDHGINLLHIESRPSKKEKGQYEFIVDCAIKNISEFNRISDELRKITKHCNVISREFKDKVDAVPYFPMTKKDLDRFANQTLTYGDELDADHPGFTDEVYRKRRKEFADIANQYRHGQEIPKVKYTDVEINTWRTIYRKLRALHKEYACDEFNHVFPLLEQNCGYNEDNIPHLQEVSDFLKGVTGFTLRPVAGLLSSRDFLAGLAYRVFHSTQYIRHPSSPLYTPEPDVCHELLGHVPLFADPAFAEFSQQFGIASLGASDEMIQKLATCYWFTIEFGICKQHGELKAYGAGLLSSYGELEYCLTDKPKHLPFNPSVTSNTKYPITEYQPVYFITDSFEDAKNKLSEFANASTKPFTVRYEPYTESMEILDSKPQILRLLRGINRDVNTLTDALEDLESI